LTPVKIVQAHHPSVQNRIPVVFGARIWGVRGALLHTCSKQHCSLLQL